MHLLVVGRGRVGGRNQKLTTTKVRLQNHAETLLKTSEAVTVDPGPLWQGVRGRGTILW